MSETVIMFKMAHLLIAALLIRTALCAEGNSVRDQRANLAPGAGGYGSSDIEDNYDYILDDTPPRGMRIVLVQNAYFGHRSWL